MKTSIEFLFALSLFVTLLMGGLSYLNYRRGKSKKMAHFAELWMALAVNVIACGVFQNMLPQVVALSMVGWIWPIRGFRLFLEDLTESELFHRWELITLGLGGFVSVAMASYGYTFTQYTLPFTLTVVFVGLSMVTEARKKIAVKESSFLLKIALYLT